MLRVLLLAAAARAARHQRPCPKVYIYDLPAYWDYDTPLNELHTTSAKTIFGPPCKKSPQEPEAPAYAVQAHER